MKQVLTRWVVFTRREEVVSVSYRADCSQVSQSPIYSKRKTRKYRVQGRTENLLGHQGHGEQPRKHNQEVVPTKSDRK